MRPSSACAARMCRCRSVMNWKWRCSLRWKRWSRPSRKSLNRKERSPMAAEITMPQLSDTMTEGTLVKWYKREGEKINEGEAIADIETDKATMPLEVFESGTVAIVAVQEGEKVNVGDRLAVLATGNEKVEEIKARYSGKTETKAKAQPVAVGA